MFPIKNRYDEVFRIEVEGWCYGLANYPGEMSSAIVHRVVRELAMSFEAAIQHNVAFSAVEIARLFSEAVDGLVSQKDMTFSILAQLPNPSLLEEEQQFVLGLIVDEVENTYGGAHVRFEKRWRPVTKRAA